MRAGRSRRFAAGLGAVAAMLPVVTLAQPAPASAAQEPTDLRVAFSPEHAIVEVGDTVEVTFTVGNDGPEDTVELVYRLSFRQELELVSPAPEGCVEQHTTFTTSFDCPVGSLAAGSQISEVVTVRLIAVAEAGLTLIARDLATSSVARVGGMSIEPPTRSDIAVEAPPVTVEAGIGEPFDVTVTVRNAGPRPAQAVEIRVHFAPDDMADPQFLFLASDRDLPADCRGEGEVQPNVVICTRGPVPVDGSVDLVLPLEASEHGEHRADVIVGVRGDEDYETSDDTRNNRVTLLVTAAPPSTTPPSTSPPPLGLPVTGLNLQVIGLTALALLGGGAILLFIGSRRRRTRS